MKILQIVLVLGLAMYVLADGGGGKSNGDSNSDDNSDSNSDDDSDSNSKGSDDDSDSNENKVQHTTSGGIKNSTDSDSDSESNESTRGSHELGAPKKCRGGKGCSSGMSFPKTLAGKIVKVEKNMETCVTTRQYKVRGEVMCCTKTQLVSRFDEPTVKKELDTCVDMSEHMVTIDNIGGCGPTVGQIVVHKNKVCCHHKCSKHPNQHINEAFGKRRTCFPKPGHGGDNSTTTSSTTTAATVTSAVVAAT